MNMERYDYIKKIFTDLVIKRYETAANLDKVLGKIDALVKEEPSDNLIEDEIAKAKCFRAIDVLVEEKLTKIECILWEGFDDIFEKKKGS
jgi:hypothetical protein